ncbi:claudin-20-like [Solea solea]|uniref:claudin-20-like n=1 Tax=Solea solea TaxID=90069 RepID=UPI00272D02CB|nr:claudin-20-like [Solea solea]
MLPAAIQILAFALALLGVLGATVATLLPNWTVSVGSWSGVMAPVSQMRGLWMDCVWYSSGIFSCTVQNSVLSLPPSLLTTRVAMVLTCMVASFGLCLASLGLKCTRWGGSHRAKGHTAIAAGACFVLASFLCLVPASWFTNEVITTFLTTGLPDSSKYQPGGALCVSFISAGFLLAAGVIFCLSCPGGRTRRPDDAEADGAQHGRRREEHGRRRREEQRKRREEERRRREQKAERVRPEQRENKSVWLQTDKPTPHRSPSKLLPKDVKDSYSLQEYV